MRIQLLGRAGKFAVHLTLAFLAWLLAEALATGRAAGLASLAAAGLFALSAGLVEMVFRVERAPWRFVAVPDVLRLGRSAFVAGLVFLVLSAVLAPGLGLAGAGGVRAVILAFGIDFLALAGLRILRRAMLEGGIASTLLRLRPAPRAAASRAPLLIVGPAAEAEAFLRAPEAALGDRYTVVGVVTPHGRHVGDELRGVCVLGAIGDFDTVMATLGGGSANPRAILFLTPPDVLGSERLGRLKSEGVRLLRLPGVIDLNSAPGRMHEISLEELLSRPQVRLDREAGRAMVAGRRVMVTGAGGSIGSELVRQIAAADCARLILLDCSEAALFQIEREIAEARPGLELRPILCDVRDPVRLGAVFAAERPNLVFHAAALKHVPLVEQNPAEGVRTNVLGARNVAQAARAAGVEHLTFISTDKAVAPASVMGATKRVAEAIIRQAGSVGAGPRSVPPLRTSVVRFGNVLGSTGSVATIFRRQIERGGPVTVTDEAMTRYFMTIPEAVSLVLRASALAAGGAKAGVLAEPGVMTLEMGEPVRIIDLARRMIELQGLAPGRDIAIEVTGLRPGEKLTEELVDVNEVQAPCAPGVNQAVATAPVALVGDRDLAELETLAVSGDETALRAALFGLVDRLRGVAPPADASTAEAPAPVRKGAGRG